MGGMENWASPANEIRQERGRWGTGDGGTGSKSGSRPFGTSSGEEDKGGKEREANRRHV